MPWTEFKLNDGHKIPGVGFGSSGHPLERTADDINLAIECGFDHIDTAQSRSPSLSHAMSRDEIYRKKRRES
jgi:diketogulonate reductase-like aldo/keto reductase